MKDEKKTISPWMDAVFDILKDLTSRLKQEQPKELPEEVNAAFWEEATRQEFQHRDELTEKIRLALSGKMQSVSEWSPILCWLCSKRIEWTYQILLESLIRDVKAYEDSPIEFLRKTMADEWAHEGALAFWGHAMDREGKPPDDFVS